MVGKFEGNARGFGFVVLEEDGEGEDIFISEGDVNDALNGDRVLVTLKNSKVGRRREGQIVKVVEHAITEVVGTFQKSKNFGFVVPDNAKISKDIFVPIEKSKSAVNGHKVVVKITDYGKKNKNPEGVITEIIGHINDPGTDIMSIIKCLGIPVEYPDDVMKQVENVPDEVDGKDIAGRTDLRDVVMVTISIPDLCLVRQ